VAIYNVPLAPVAGNPAVVAASTMFAEPPPPPPLSEIDTILPAAFFVKMAGDEESHRIASSFVSKSLVVGTALAVYERFGFIFEGINSP
jgi:hypothetical protein